MGPPPLSDQRAAALPADLRSVAKAAAGSYADAVHQLLAIVRTQLGMQVAWVSEFIGTHQVLRFVDAEPGVQAPAEGTSIPMGGTFCARVLDGRFPSLIPDARKVPEAALLNLTSDVQFGAYIGVPLLGPEGVAVGMLCTWHDAACPGLTERDMAAVQLLAALLHDLQGRALTGMQAERDREEVRLAVQAVVGGAGRHAVLQPVIDLTTGRAVAAEGLTRFTAPSPVGADQTARSPAHWFDDASRLGLRTALELGAARSVLDLLGDGIPAGVALTVNLGPEALLGPSLATLLADRPLDRIVIELTENAPVDDYDQLATVLRPYRDDGLRIAVDDAGAGYASLRHVLDVHPDLLKVDMTLTRGVDGDLARQTLLTALCGFAEATGCQLVAEGVETEQELRAVAACGVPLVQGYYLSRPSTTPVWDGYPTA
jgi:EAL domain-containing protein (putative c-di-GMP-specific phosphodiesterase class I)